MANPQRVPDPRYTDPADPVSRAGVDPLVDPRVAPANSQIPPSERTVVKQRSGGSGVLIAAVVLVLAVIAYFIFAPGAEAPAPATDQPATTSEPAAPAPEATPAPDATAPAAPADTAPPAPDATAPAAPAEPAAPAPDATAPAEPAPAEPAPAQ
jgi:hypothetical protein